jgi:salicylate hydroxylase
MLAYRMFVDTEDLLQIDGLTKLLDPKDPWTTMLWGHKCRAVMGPGRGGKVYGIVALVPDGMSAT